MATYTVKRGDTLSGIAQSQLGSAYRWQEIADLNHLANPDLIYPGQELRLPGSGGFVSALVDFFKRR